ncbi:hypothetical protein EYR40_007211 [Pleurotus pulmonarius]|nr:hypothetical protein EYR40_007211 [Pleurotus pulmonarius]
MATVTMKSSVCITSQGGQETREVSKFSIVFDEDMAQSIYFQQCVSPTSPASSNSSLSDEEIAKAQCELDDDEDEDTDPGVVFIARRVRVTQVKGTLVHVQRS